MFHGEFPDFSHQNPQQNPHVLAAPPATAAKATQAAPRRCAGAAPGSWKRPTALPGGGIFFGRKMMEILGRKIEKVIFDT